MQTLQKRYGKDKLEILLISVDTSYFRDRAAIAKRLKQPMNQHKVNWPCVIEPTGWNGVMRRFNLDGYGLSLVDPDGIVRGVDLHGEEVDALLRSIFKRQGQKVSR